ncbi:lipid asymmetry maintenance protein MlaB [Pandoraea sp.]|jgi:phospholipid transport system transporter-binding protein|uniref:STAS domain-containing protein n=1 Tax=Pandoraea sp. TaxID=1883445 RepID=UPI0018EDDED5|nr:STAS domain-containing protein [Pandoraea sp.]MDR3398680.1 STAS domain-containing protein [Pandoraea sp.]
MLALQTDLTHDTAGDVLAQAIDRIDAGETQIDCAGLKHFDSSALAVLLALRRHAVRRGATLAFTNLPTGLASLALVYGVDHLLSS